MWHLRQRDAAGVATDQNIDFFIGEELTNRANAGFRVLGFIRNDELHLATEDAALLVDLVDGHFDGSDGVTTYLQLHRSRYTNAYWLIVILRQCCGRLQ